jgi:flagellar basal-body rod modification protein FlgD
MATSSITSASEIQTDYMTLLVTQLQNQNPLEPMDNDQMASQLAQFSQLQQLESMNTSFSDVLNTANRTYANSLLDKNVTFYYQDETTGSYIQKEGTVKSVYYDASTGETKLGVTSTNTGTGTTSEFTLGLDAVVLTEN